jgi:hypothetical protein
MGKFTLGFSALSLGMVLGLTAGEAQAFPLASRPSTPVLIENAQTVVVIRRYRPWRAHRHHRLRVYRMPPQAAWGEPYFLGSPGYALFPPDDEFLPPSERRRLRLNQNLGPKRAATEVREKRPKHATSTAEEIPTARQRPKQNKVIRKNTQVAVAAPEATELPKRKAEQKPKASASKGLSCDKAAGVVSGYAFSDVRSVSCTGSKYEFRAKRADQAYVIVVNAADGTLVKVTKRDSP